jgi:hypothetical protein
MHRPDAGSSFGSGHLTAAFDMSTGESTRVVATARQRHVAVELIERERAALAALYAPRGNTGVTPRRTTVPRLKRLTAG